MTTTSKHPSPSLLGKIVERLERTERIDWLASTLRRPAAEMVGTGRRRDLLTGAWLGHPVHPVAVLAPLSCGFASAVLDVVRPGDGVASRRLLAAGTLAAVPAIASGVADWLDTSKAEQRVATSHAVLNVTATACFGSSWWARRGGRKVSARLWSSAGLAVSALAGYLGGHLTYTRGVGVNTTAFQSGPRSWTPLVDLDVSGVPGLAAARLGTVDFVVHRTGGRTRVLEGRCTHRGGPLAEGTATEDCVTCPWHGSRFALDDGSVRRGPASVPQPAYEVRERDGAVEVRRAESGALRTMNG